MAGITSSVRGGALVDSAFPLGLKAGASTDEWGRLVLTLVATSRSEGVGEERIDAAKRKVAAPVGEAERRHGEEEGDTR
jgi:hypothetical protein